MKVPANFNASATKKLNPLEAAINGNFTQSAPAPQKASLSQNKEEKQQENTPSEARESILTASKPLAEVKSSNQAQSPLKSEVKSQIFNDTASTTEEIPVKKTVRREVKEKFLVSMSKGERSVYKAFCAIQGISMNHFVMCAMDYFKEDLEAGKVSIGAHSYKRLEK